MAAMRHCQLLHVTVDSCYKPVTLSIPAFLIDSTPCRPSWNKARRNPSVIAIIYLLVQKVEHRGARQRPKGNGNVYLKERHIDPPHPYGTTYYRPTYLPTYLPNLSRGYTHADLGHHTGP